MTEKILEVLRSMDPLDDEQWTSDGAPLMDYVQGALNDDSVTRKQILEAAPDFNRKSAGKPEDLLMNQPSGEAETGEPAIETQPEEPKDEVELNDEEEEVEEASFDGYEPETVSLKDFQKMLGKMSEAEVEEAQAQIARQVDMIDKSMKELQDMRMTALRANEQAALRLRELNPNSTESHAIREFIKSQNETRAAKVGLRKTILKGIDPSDLDPRAPIDQAMARNTKRGTKRPQRAFIVR